MFIELLKINHNTKGRDFPLYNKELSINNMLFVIEKISYDDFNKILYLKNIHIEKLKPYLKEEDIINLIKENLDLLFSQ